MVEENTDLNKGQVVTDPDLNKEQLVADPDLTTPSQGDAEGDTTLKDGTDENKTVKYADFKKVNDAKKAAEEREKLLQDQLAIAQTQQQPVQTQSQQPLTDYDQAKTDLGLKDEEYLDESQRSQIFARMAEITNTRSQQSAILLSNQQFVNSHSDFSSVVGLYNPATGLVQPTAEMAKILSEKPHLNAAANASHQGAYKIVMEQREFAKLQQQNAVNQEHLKQQGIDLKEAPVSGAAAAGGSINATGVSVTLEQQEAMEQRVANGEFNTKKG